MLSAAQISCEVLRTLANERFNFSFIELILQKSSRKINHDGYGPKAITKHKHSSLLLEAGGPRRLSWHSESLRPGRSGDRIPLWARFSAPVQTGPGAHSASYTVGTGFLLRVKRPRGGGGHPPPPQSSAEVKERVELYLCSTSGPSWPVLGCTLLYLLLEVN
jgi:hypothetical protein